ncbi:MAG TPA: MFS transporter [Chloroflexota bacterium]|nr:MFS transporter [Chloroflexota bacterium]
MRAYFTLSAVLFCGYVGIGSASPFQTLYATSLGASLEQVALITGVFSTTAMAAGLAWGRLADRVGRRKPFVVWAMAGMSAAHAVTALIPTWQVLVPLRLAEGVAYGANQMASLALMGRILEGHAQRGRLVSGYRMSGSLAFSVAIVISGWIAQNAGFRGSYLLAAAVYAIAFCIALTIPESAEPPRREAPAGEAVDRLGYRALLTGELRPLLILAVAYGLPFSAVYSVWPIWVANDLGHGRAVYSQLWGLAAFVEVPCMLLSGYLIDRIGRRRTFTLGLAAFALVYLAYVAAPPLPGLIAAQALRGFAFAAFTATSLTMAIELAPPTARGRAAGLYQTANSLAQISGAWIGAPLAAGLGFRPLYALAALAVAGAAVYARGAVTRRG